MARDGAYLGKEDVGDLSYSAMDGGREEDLKRREFSRSSRSSRVWIGDSMRYSTLGREYAANLYNFAWAQAVQNKPLVSFVEVASMDSESANSVENVESDGVEDKEEGELEEGEIILASPDADFIDENSRDLSNEGNSSVMSQENPDPPPDVTIEGNNPSGNIESEEEVDFDLLVATALEELEDINEDYAEKYFEEACPRLCKTLDNLHKMFSESNLPLLEALAQQALMGVRTVFSVFMKRKNQGRETLFRLLAHMKNRVSELFTPEQMKEVDEMMESVACVASNKGIQTITKPQKDLINWNNDTIAPISPKVRADYLPLLDLHSNHDGDSLPSPTREGIVLPLPDKRLSAEKPRESVPRASTLKKDAREKDGTTFSTYQQKYSRASFLPSDELPSPTPSEECNGSTGDLLEVSSSSISLQPAVSISGSLPGLISKPVEREIASGLNVPGKTSLKSRDPRLKLSLPTANVVGFDGLAHGSVTNPKKHGYVDQSLQGNPTFKRQKVELSDRNDFPMSTRKEGHIGGTDFLVGQQGSKGLTTREPSVLSSPPMVSLLSLLKGVTGDPSILTNLIKEKQRLAVQTQPKIASSVLVERPTEVVPSTSCHLPTFPISEKIEAKSKGASQASQILLDTQDGAGKIRMKSRDPRRILHSNTLQKSEQDQLKVGVDQKKSTVRDQGDQTQVSLSSPQLTLVPNAPNQVNQVAKSLSDAMQASQAASQTFSTKAETGNAPNQVNKGAKSLSDAMPASQAAFQTVSTKAETGNVTTAADGLNDQQPSNPWGDMDHLLDGYDDLQKAAIQLERARRIAEQNKMIADRKLCLVLDLDHTLLNSAKFSEVDPVHEEILRRKEEQDREKPQRSLFRFPHMGMWTKLRPGIWSFLERTSKLFELHLYTMGNKLYATEMAKVLDPSGVLFAGRVISKGDEDDLFNGEERVPKSKDLEGVLGLESAVVIIDDSLKVWPHHKLNLIVVERYTYFPCSRRQFGMPGPSLLEIDHDERLEDGTLASSLAVIERIHETYYAAKCPGDMDVRNIIASEQQRILSGCRIVFSRVFPVGEMKPHRHPLWQIAEQFGATCTNQIDDQVTHVVAYSLGTDKVNWALSTGRFVVHPGWVEASALLYRRANEVDFAIKPLLPQPP